MNGLLLISKSVCWQINSANAPAQTLQKAFAEKLTEKIGANAMREKCPLFDSWLKNIEALA
ncbi:hypothetical protein [Vibrio parahaemolyticus]